ncbi:hypothetical protein PMI04_005560 [Sphingobium sp. AP49]|nr:hypothetical protein [Sphingobium sp. AP49]WHO40060.1 hypothetical protein PMI04_005560 [Sphingobium sp. AP49]
MRQWPFLAGPSTKKLSLSGPPAQEWDCLASPKALRIGAQAQWGVSFSPRVVCNSFFSERGLPMSKSIALSLVLAASLGLAACGSHTENAANNAANAAENASNAADNAMNAAMNAADNAANAASNATNNVANAM